MDDVMYKHLDLDHWNCSKQVKKLREDLNTIIVNNIKDAYKISKIFNRAESHIKLCKSSGRCQYDDGCDKCLMVKFLELLRNNYER